MSRHERSPLHGSVVALALTSAALLVSMLLQSRLEPSFFLVFELVVWLSAWYYGLTAGLVATASSAIALILVFAMGGTPPALTLTRAGLFLAVAVLISWTTASWRQSRRILASTLASIGDAVVVTDNHGRITLVNPVAQALTGWAEDEACKRAVEDVLQLVDERTRQTVENPLTRALHDRAVVTTGEDILLVSRNGTETPIEHSAAPVRGYSGEVRGAILVFRDTRKRRQFEQQSTQAQKMDAMARLAGSVAGDFNNMLTVISGYAELLRLEIPSSSAARKYVDEINYASERAAAVTRHLLAFSRGSAVDARVLDLNQMLSHMEPMLRRLLGQNIELMILPGAELGRVRIDGAQMEQVIVNLATNARDAMPDGGKLAVETANVDVEELDSKRLGIRPGEYVMLAVSDTGTGITPENRSRVFEPFFTTKAPGKGSGLGLAAAYGSVKQAEGQITVYSQPDCGTIFEVYLPRAGAPTESEAKAAPKGSETILLVDDEEGVRKICGAVLEANGYNVLAASGAQAAIAIYEKNAHKVDLLLTDVVMPQMNGFELGRRLGERNPGLKILYMSGYRENVSDSGAPISLLSKPFTPDVLLEKVRVTLDAEVR
ncbi:MAG: sensor hybrid histidine kinase [Candidatus Solibacter sp.]|jgi:two-component system cell cycle sensor histidine kinase/response regulator CckA|nr:sensor hybrid histidine kinase [Candidatus Solibacter sp.]